MSETLARPEAAADEPIYSNFDHQVDAKVAEQVESKPGELYAQHAAWNFCGSVWCLPDGRWVDQVWCYHVPVEDIIGDSLMAVIERANGNYGCE